MTIVVDPAGNPPQGAKPRRRTAEADAMRLAQSLAQALAALGVDAVLIREPGCAASNAQRAAVCAAARPDFVLSVDRGVAPGAELWLATAIPAAALARYTALLLPLAEAGRLEMVSAGRGYPGNRNGDFWLNRACAAPSALLRLLDVTSRKENARFDRLLGPMAQALADGLVAALGGV